MHHQSDYYEPQQVSKLVDISRSMAAEIEFENDEGNWDSQENSKQRWHRIRKWVDTKIYLQSSGNMFQSDIEYGEGPFISTLSEKYRMCSCPTSQLMATGCNCGGS